VEIQRYLVLPTNIIQAHKHVLSQTLTPQIDNLLIRAETHLTSQGSKIARLEERLKLVEKARLPPMPLRERVVSHPRSFAGLVGLEHGEEGGGGEGSKLNGLEMRDLSIVQRRKVMMLRSKRERMEKELKRLREQTAE
jgi:DASH complex subunit SPC19